MRPDPHADSGRRGRTAGPGRTDLAGHPGHGGSGGAGRPVRRFGTADRDGAALVGREPPGQLAWLARHEPDTVRRTRWLLQPKDLVGLWLTGSAASDPWSSKGICRVTDGEPARTHHDVPLRGGAR